MTNNQILTIIIIICLVIVVMAMFPNFFKMIGRLIMNCTIGIGLIWGINYILVNVFNLETFNVGINIVSALVVSILGIPGVASLYIVQYLVG